MGMPRGERSPDQTHVTISMPKKLLAEIDEEAKANNRTRSNWIVTELTAALKVKRQLRVSENFPEAGESHDAAAGGRSTVSTRTTPAAPGSEITFNEESPKDHAKPRVTPARAALRKMQAREGKKK